jgi:hypothetical protein
MTTMRSGLLRLRERMTMRRHALAVEAVPDAVRRLLHATRQPMIPLAQRQEQ